MASELAGACSGEPQSIGSRVWIADESTVDFGERAEDAERSTPLDEAPNCWRKAEPPCTVEARSFLKLALTGSIAALQSWLSVESAGMHSGRAGG